MRGLDRGSGASWASSPPGCQPTLGTVSRPAGLRSQTPRSPEHFDLYYEKMSPALISPCLAGNPDPLFCPQEPGSDDGGHSEP